MEAAEQAAPPAVVLVADDNQEARRMLEVRVTREGYRVLLVENGQQALDVLAQERVDVILLDIYMPVLDGFHVLAAVKANGLLAHVPVLMISGGGDQEDLVRCIEMGAIDYLAKPFNQAVLRARLASCVSAKRQRDRELSLLQHSPRLAATSSATPPPDGQSRPKSARTEAPMPPRVGRIVLRQFLGEGGMGQVYLGHHELLDIPVAVKLLRPALVNTANARERFLREARISARISHRNVVRLHEVGEVGDTIYLAYEYIDGGSLKELLDRRPGEPLDIPTVVRITREIAQALGEAHRLGILHRDIKPANILLTNDGGVKVADLGLAREFGGSAAPTLTAEYVVVGTAAYMAPEQIEGLQEIDARADLYALGAVLYEMLTGRPPFEGSSPMVVLSCHLFSPVTPPSHHVKTVPPWLEGICLQLLAKSRDDRYASHENICADLAANAGAA